MWFLRCQPLVYYTLTLYGLTEMVYSSSDGSQIHLGWHKCELLKNCHFFDRVSLRVVGNLKYMLLF